MEDFHHTYPETIHSKIFRPQSKASQTPTNDSGELMAGRWDKQACWAPHGRLEEGWEAPWHSNGMLILPTAFKTNWWFLERSVKTLLLEARSYVWHSKSVSFHNKTAPLCFLNSKPSLITSSPTETDGCSSIFSHALAFPGFYPSPVPREPH